MAIAHVGAGTVLHATSMVTGETDSTEFADSRPATGTVITCLVVGSGGTLRVYKKMRASGEFVEISSEAVTAGTGNPTVVSLDFPLGHGKASFDPGLTYGDVTLIEIEMRSRGR